GRGDGFVLQIADRTSGTVVSNDSFQEFHADYRWLFDTGRLIGGKPVPGVGWIFSLRKPVRGPVSRKVMEQDKKAGRADKAAKAVKQAIAEAKAEAMGTPARSKPRRRGGRHGSSSPPEAVNEPAPFLQFVIDHRLGSAIVGTVDAFTSHGAFVMVDGMRCYVPISALGDPPPSRARDVLRRGEIREFVVQAVDAPRRGIELGLPGFSNIAGTPTDETVAAEVARSKPKRAAAKSATDGAKPAKSAAKSAAKKAKKTAKATPATPAERAAKGAPAKTAKQPAGKSAAAKKTSGAKKSTGTKAAAKKRQAGAKTAKRQAG
ncbi:MAG TPA: S1 RNA-binding domain-containing protein, partial [Acidimicrobiia bacterium]